MPSEPQHRKSFADKKILQKGVSNRLRTWHPPTNMRTGIGVVRHNRFPHPLPHLRNLRNLRIDFLLKCMIRRFLRLRR
jgi:hypothetical protein